MKEFFGGRLRFLVTGSAPLSKDIIDFFKIATSCPFYEGYGLTEAVGISFITQKWDSTSGHIGGPTACTEFKLVNVSEMNYTCKDGVERMPLNSKSIAITSLSLMTFFMKGNNCGKL